MKRLWRHNPILKPLGMCALFLGGFLNVPSSWAVTFLPNPLLPTSTSTLSLSPRKSDCANHAALQAGLQDADPKDAHVLPPLRPHVVPPSEEGVQRLRLPVGAQQALQLGREDDSQEEPRHWPHALREGAAAPLQERLPREGEPPQTAIRTGACSRACQPPSAAELLEQAASFQAGHERQRSTSAA